MKLVNVSQKTTIVPKVVKASTYLERLIGLMGKKNLPTDETLYFEKCSSVHTFFMRFPMDCVFVDEDMKVCGVFQNIKPFRVVLPRLKFDACFEFMANGIGEKVQLGDQLNVVP